MKKILRDQHYVAECLDEPDDASRLDDLVRFADEVYAAAAVSRRSPPRTLRDPGGVEPSSSRERAVARVLAAEAEGWERVRIFRYLHLRPAARVELLDPEAVHPWIAAKSAGEPSQWLEVFAVPSVSGEADGDQVVLPPPGHGLRHLLYEAPNPRQPALRAPSGWYVHNMPTVAGGTLDRLRVLSEALADGYGWSTAAASTWVLTGAVPWVRSFHAHRRTLDPPVASRIVLEIDPALTPDEVARRYRRTRARMVSSSLRAQTEKHLALGAFAAEKPHDEGWESARRRWNAEHPEWAYDGMVDPARQFGRDCRSALKRLRDPGHALRFGTARPVEAVEPT